MSPPRHRAPPPRPEAASRARVAPPPAAATRATAHGQGSGAAGPTLLVAGLGNIGSQFIDQVARLTGLARVLVVDRDRYEESNLGSQAITRQDVGRPKAEVQARRLRRLRPDLQVEARVADLGALPLGLFRGVLVVACLDSLVARLRLAEMAWRMGARMLDSGVHPESGLVRVTGYWPGPGRPCLGCALDDEDLRSLGAVHPCGAVPAAGPTQGSFSLGGLAAALLATECAKALSAPAAAPLWGRELLFEAGHHRVFHTRLECNPACRLGHDLWSPEPLEGIRPASTLGDLLSAAQRFLKGARPPALRLADQRLAKALHCPGCGAMVERLHVVGRVRPLRCRRCRAHNLEAVGFKIVDQLDGNLSGAWRHLPLEQVGLLPGDVFAIEGHRRCQHLEIPCDDP